MPEVLGVRLATGFASGDVMAMPEPISFWGGVDRHGTVIDVHHPRHGQSIVGRVIVMPTGRGSSSSAYVLGELIRTGSNPAAVILAEPDGIVAMGVLVAAELYDRHMPFVALNPEVLATIPDGVAVTVNASNDVAKVSWTA